MHEKFISHDSLMPLAISGLRYSVGESILIDNLELYVSSAGVTVILGPNGAGKSLLLRLILGLLEPTGGRVKWGKHSAGSLTRQHQSLVFQKPVLLRRSVEDNIKFILKLRQSAPVSTTAQKLLQSVHLSEHARQPARSLSGGEQQRLALARAMATSPSVLMLDEATANLDPGSTAIIENIIRKQKQKGVKILLVTHDLGQAKRLADDVVFLHRGRVMENTPATQFFDQPDSAPANAFLHGELI
ncbi:MAG: ATP-binding cassette domain-containing protein [Pseudomonadota bacterium]